MHPLGHNKLVSPQHNITTQFDNRLGMQDVLGRHLSRANGSNVLSSDDVGILILGDSADRNLIFDLCIEAGQQVCT